jgi:large subunit ribosomal protein L3
MATRIGLLGKKIGMTQVFADDGERVPVTVIQVGPNFVVGKRTVEKDGYSALILGFDEKPVRLVNRPELGGFKEGLKPQRFVRELRLEADEVEKYLVGQELKAAEVFGADAAVDVTGNSKGKGFQGVIKRHKMTGKPATHGTHEYFRHGGSIGCRLTPQRVHKGKRMGGQMGNETKTVQNLQLFRFMDEDGCIMIRGAIPGAKNDYVVVTTAATRTAYKRKGAGKDVEVRSKNPLKASKKAAAGRG